MSRSITRRHSPIHGIGVFALCDLPAGKPLIHYRGMLLTHAEADALYENNSETGHTFLFTLNSRYVIDASVDGNLARWINHSCDPNCQAVIAVSEDADPACDQVLIETLRAIKAGEELTYDYGIVLAVRHSVRLKRIWACRCGSPKCTGTLLSSKHKR